MRAAAAEVDAVQAGVQLDAVAAALETVAVYGLQGVGRLRRESARQKEGESEEARKEEVKKGEKEKGLQRGKKKSARGRVSVEEGNGEEKG